EDRVDVDGLGLAVLTHAEGTQEDDLIAIDDGDRETGHELLVDDLTRQFVELRQRRHDLFLGGGLRNGRQWNEQRRNTGKKGPADHQASLINAEEHVENLHRQSWR